MITHVTSEIKDSDSIIEITKNPNVDAGSEFVKHKKPKDLASTVTSVVALEICKEEIKEHVKDLKLINSNLK